MSGVKIREGRLGRGERVNKVDRKWKSMGGREGKRGRSRKGRIGGHEWR